MSWFSRGRRDAGAQAVHHAAAAAAPPGRQPRKPRAGEPAGGHEVHRSLGLATLLAGIAGLPRLEVLDLGSAVGSNIEFLASYGCKLYIEDFYSALVASLSIGGGERLGPVFFANFLAFPEGTRFNAVFAWDLLDYMDRKEIAALSSHLARYCQPGAQLLALISIGKQIPQQPHRFKIVDDGHLAYGRQGAAERPCPRYSPAELSDLMRGFRLDRSYLMRHGVQEYVFVRRAD